jgi:CheY-like chemotaxis protein
MPHKLLLADDSVTIQRVIELTFADEDVQVVVVGDGRQAIERVQSDRPDIVLADVGMPECDGYEVAAFIKNDPRLAGIPVVLLTGAFEPLDEKRARTVGCDGVLVKPFEPQMVINRVKELLSSRQPSGSRPQPAHAQVPREPEPQPAVPASSLDPDAERPSARMAINAKEKAVVDTLEDYFDRLDAAFANIGAPPPGHAPRSEQEDLSAGIAELDQLPPQRAAGSHDAVHAWDPEMTADFSPASQPHLANAFAALLAAEEGHGDAALALAPPVPAPAPALGPAAISEEAIEEIVRRVIARMADDSMRQLVAETAERLVRDEIDRIKRMAQPSGS